MKSKLLNIGLIITSLLGYLEWGKENSMFIFQGEKEIFSKLFSDPLSVIHPFILLPLLGQVLLLITLFQKRPDGKLTLSGIICIGILLVFISGIGLLSLNVRIFLSTVPFLIIAIITVRSYRKGRKRMKPKITTR